MSSSDIVTRREKTEQTKSLLRWAALFLGELRDGLTMVSLVFGFHHFVRGLKRFAFNFGLGRVMSSMTFEGGGRD